jgi:TRAP-type uncharacterized transport system substrate-binding protein
MLGFSRGQLIKGLVAFFCFLGFLFVSLAYFFPAPPSTVTIGTAFKGASYDYYGKRYRDRFARANVKLELRETAGALENLKLLLDPNSGVQIGFMNGGVSNGSLAPGLLSLGLVYYQPYWIFYTSTEPIDHLSQRKGKRIAVGPQGSATRFSAETALGRGGVTSETATFLPFAGDKAVAALNEDKVDVVWFIGAPDATGVQALLRNPRVKLMAFPMAEALSRIYPDLVRLVLPQGVVDLDKIIPPNDVQLIGSTTRVLVRDDLHPQIIALLLKTMTEEHGGPGIFQRVGEFPNANDSEYPVAPIAIDYYRNGPSFLQKHLPIWLEVHAQRAIAALVTILAIGLPMFNYLPKLYMWLVRENMSRLYRRLRTIEKGLQSGLTIPQVADFQNDLEDIDKAASHLHVPMRHSALFMGIKVHINLVRTRLAVRLVAEPNSQSYLGATS